MAPADVEDLVASLGSMAAALPDYPGSVRGQRFRNALLVKIARRRGIAAPRNGAILRDLGVA